MNCFVKKWDQNIPILLMLTTLFRKKMIYRKDIIVRSYEKKPWGTGHAVWSSRNKLANSPFAVINADDFYGKQTFEALYKRFTDISLLSSKSKMSCAMVGFRLSETVSEYGSVSRGICYTENGILKNVEEWTDIQGNPIMGIDSIGVKRELSGNVVVSMNVWAFPSDVFNYLERSFSDFLGSLSDPINEEFYLPSAVDQWINQGIAEVQVHEASCRWMGITYREDKPYVQSVISSLVKTVFIIAQFCQINEAIKINYIIKN